MVTTLSGSNWHAIKSELDKRVNAFVDEYGELALERIEAEEIESGKIIQSIETLPFLASKKMCVVSGLSQNKLAAEQVEQIIDRTSDDSELIIVENKLDKRGSLYKTLKSKTDFLEFSELDEYSGAKWILDEAKSHNAELQMGEAQYLYSLVGGNQSRLANEIKKLAEYDQKISRKSIDLLVEPNPSSSVFDLLESAFSGNKKRTMQIYNDLRLQRVEPLMIISMIVWQMHVVALCESAKGVDASRLAIESKINPYVIRKSQTIASRLTRQKIQAILDELVDIDYRLKNTKIDVDQAMEYLLIFLLETSSQQAS